MTKFELFKLATEFYPHPKNDGFDVIIQNGRADDYSGFYDVIVYNSCGYSLAVEKWVSGVCSFISLSDSMVLVI